MDGHHLYERADYALYFGKQNHRGGAVLDPHGLACGYNVRTFVTLRALAQVRAVLTI